VRLLILAAALVALAGCQKKSDPPDSAPTNVTATEGDGVVLISWDVLPDLTYWIFYRPGDTVSAAETGSTAIRRAFEPRVVSGLLNGTRYAFVMNATQNDSAAGPSSLVVTATPRLAGDTWVSGAALATANLNGLAVSGTRLVAVGDGATIFYADVNYGNNTPPGVTAWNPPATPLPPEVVGKNLSSVTFNGISFVAMATDGTIISSIDGSTWFSDPAVPAPAGVNMNSIAYAPILGIPTYFAVGDGGTIFTGSSITPSAWTPQTSGTGNDLNNISVAHGFLVATGTNGTLVISGDGQTWYPQTTGTTSTLRSTAFDAFTTNIQYVVVGDGGAVVTAPIVNNPPVNVTWSATVLAGAPNLRSVTVGGASLARFLAVGLAGAAVYSDDGTTWTPAQATPPVGDFSSVLFANAMYIALGAAGANAVSR
jgi:hypothetical protein